MPNISTPNRLLASSDSRGCPCASSLVPHPAGKRVVVLKSPRHLKLHALELHPTLRPVSLASVPACLITVLAADDG